MPYEKKNYLESKLLDFICKFIKKNEEDYCRKKGLDIKKLDWKDFNNMRNAVNKRKKVRELNNLLISFNPLARGFLRR